MKEVRRFVGMFAVAGMSFGCASGPEIIPPTGQGIPPQIFLEEEQERTVLPEGVELRKVNDATLNLTATMEGFRSRLYEDAAGHCTIGYGHLIRLGACTGGESPTFKKGISKIHGRELLSGDMQKAEIAVMGMLTGEVTDGQYGALCDFAFNLGVNRLRKSRLIQYVNAEDHAKAVAEFGRYVKAGGKVLDGLVTRRNLEIELYQEGLAITRLVPREDEPAVEFIDVLGPLD